MRSRTGCLTCRNRKLKCDEQKPVCGQCTKAKRNCVPSPGVVFRHQQNASLNGDRGASSSADGVSSSSSAGGGLKNFYGYKETFGVNSVWVDVPRQLTFIHTNNPYEDPGTPQVARGGNSNNISNSIHGHGFAQQTDSADVRGFGDSASSGAWQQQNASGSYSYPSYHTTTSQASTHGLEALSAAASGDHYYQGYRGSGSLSELAQTAVAARGIEQQLSHQHQQHDEPRSLSPPIDPQLHNTDLSGDASAPVRFADTLEMMPRLDSSALDNEVKSDNDVPFLLRYFSEGPGAWMDLFDLSSFFAVDVPVKAATCPLLLYAAIALSAKALAQIRISAQYIKQTASKRTPSQWLHKARYYYDIAIGLLRQALEDGTRASDSVETHLSSAPQTSSTGTDAFSQWRDRNSSQGSIALPRTDSEELVATTAVLCVYEFLDASGLEWSRHLDGAKSLFDIARDGTLPLAATAGSPNGPAVVSAPSSSTKGRRAVFWNICRQELIYAFINNKETRLDTSDIDMWRSAGLCISPTGFIVPSNQPDMHTPMADDMIANALMWLMMKIVNFIAVGDDFPHELGLGIRQSQLLDYWEGLEKQLDAWYEGLPDSFRPTSEVWPNSNETGHGDRLNIPKKWFARPMCAAAMQSYHFARIQLLANKPHLSTGLPYERLSGVGSGGGGVGVEPSSLAQRHASYATILNQSRKHAEDIVSIGLALTNDSARIHSVQPLYTAGQVLGNGDEGRPWKTVEDVRICILDLLQGIQRETGWATEYRMQNLIESWGLPPGGEARSGSSGAADLHSG